MLVEDDEHNDAIASATTAQQRRSGGFPLTSFSSNAGTAVGTSVSGSSDGEHSNGHDEAETALLPFTRPRSWTEEDDNSKVRPHGASVPRGLLQRLGDNALARRVVWPCVRWWWPCTPRKFAWNMLTLFLLGFMTLFWLEILGRIRFQGYLIASEDSGNGQMGFYHEMDIDMRALRDASQHPTSKLYAANAINSREIKAWMMERWQRTNGRKYLVGCTADWRGYVLRSFLHLFEELKTNHGWDELITNDPLDFFYRQDPNRAPSVLFFCLNSNKAPYYLFLDHNKYFQELRALGTIIVVWSDDLQYYDQFNPITLRERIFKRVDVMAGSYSYITDDYFASVTAPMNPRDLPVLFWLPHSAGPDFIQAPFNTHPIHKIFLSGKLGETFYPLRHWLGGYQTSHEDVMDLYRHSGYHVADNQTAIYASYMRSYRIGITTTLIFQYIIAKVFEIPAVGALLLVNDDLVEIFGSLGLRPMEHIVTFNRTDPEPAFWWVLDPSNREKIEDMRAKAMAHVRAKHLVQHRVMALNDFLTEGINTYAFPPTFRISSPCPTIAIPSEATCESLYQWNARYKCDIWFCGVRSLVYGN